MGEKNMVDSSTENALIKKVELYSVGWLCEPDLTGSCHVFTVTYTNREKVLFIIDAWAFQKASSAERNALFDPIFRTEKPWCIIDSHGHFDHSGRVVPIHKGLMAEHNMQHIPVLMSQATRELLPAILRSYHREKKDLKSSYDSVVAKFWSVIEKFFAVYTIRPKATKPTRKCHKPYGERMQEKKNEKIRDINALKYEFEANGGLISENDLIVPTYLSHAEKKVLNKILSWIDELKKNHSDKFTAREIKLFSSVESALPRLLLGDKTEEQFRIIMETDIPRENGDERKKKVTEIRDFLESKIAEKYQPLLPEVSEEDIGILVRQSQWLPTSIPHPLPWVPWVTMTLRPTGHMLGAVSIELEFKMVKDEVKRILVSGDLGSWTKPTIHGVPQLPQKKADIVIMETTNAGKIHPEIAQSITRIIEFIQTKKGPIIMPVFAIDRMHVVFHMFWEMIRKGEFPCPIFWRNDLGADTLSTYLRYLPELREIFSKIIPLNGKNNGEKMHRLIESDEHCLVGCSGWGLQAWSTAWNVFNTRQQTWKEIFLLMTWYQPAWLGKKIMEAFQAGTDPEEILEITDNFETYFIKRWNICLGDYFSWHGDRRDLSRFAEIGDERYLIHGNPKSAAEFAENIGWATIIKPNTTITLLGK
jgi:Cft2 family RNA processing exonuclease